MAASANRIKLEVFGRTTNLPPDDGVSAAIDQAQERVNMIRKWYADATGASGGASESETTVGDDDTSDTRWEELTELEAIAILIRRFRSPQDAAIYKATQIDPFMLEIANTYSADWGSAFGETNSITPGNLRKSVIASLIRKKDPVFPPLSEVDRAIQEEFIILWEARKWRFRRRPLWLKIKTDGSMTSAYDDITFDGIASKIIFVKDTATKVVTHCEWKDSTRFAELMSRYANATDSTGVPQYFFLVPEGDQEVIQFLPEPDEEYDAFATIYIGAPTLGSSNNSDTGLKKLPSSFRMHLRDRIISRVMHEYSKNGPEANRFANKVEKDYLSLLAEFDDTGSNEWNASHWQRGKWSGTFRSGRGKYIGGYG